MSYPVQSIAVLPSPNNFPAYARAVSNIEHLNAHEEKKLLHKWLKENDQDAAKTLVLAHLYLVVKIVRNHQGYGLNLGDLAQEGTVGLMKAVHKFDGRPGVRLATYAWYWVEAEIKEFVLKNWRLVGWGTSTLAKKLFFGYRKTVVALRGLGEQRQVPSVHDIAKALDVSPQDAQLTHEYFMGGDVQLADEHDSHENDPSEQTSRVPTLRLGHDDTPEEELAQTHRTQLATQAVGAMRVLSDRQKDIITHRFLADPPVTLSALAKKWNVSTQRVRQIEQKALVVLRETMDATTLAARTQPLLSPPTPPVAPRRRGRPKNQSKSAIA